MKSLIVFLLLFSIYLFGQEAPPWISGTGTSGDPYMLYNAQDLDSLRVSARFPFDGHLFFKLNNDIDLSSYSDWIPIHFTSNPTTVWRNHLNLNGFIISNLSMTTTRIYGASAGSSAMGLFTIIGDDASNPTVANVYNGRIQNVNFTFTGAVSSSNYRIGIIAASTYNAGSTDREYLREIMIEDAQINVNWTGAFFTEVRIGGAIGDNHKILYRVSVKADLNINIAGNSPFNGNFIGGITGATRGRIEQCAFIGKILTPGTFNVYVGGIVADWGGTAPDIVNSYVRSEKMTNIYWMGGIVGKQASDVNDTIKYSYSVIDTLIGTNAVDVDGLILGEVANANGKVYSTYSDTEFVKLDYYAGTTIDGDRTLRNLHTSFPTADSGLAISTALAKTQGTYIGWDFTNVWNMHPYINDGYPFLRFGFVGIGLAYPNQLSPILVFEGGETIQVKWSKYGTSDIDLSFSTDNGNEWTLLQAEITDTFYNYILPDETIGEAKFKIEAVEFGQLFQSIGEKFTIIGSDASYLDLTNVTVSAIGLATPTATIYTYALHIPLVKYYIGADGINWDFLSQDILIDGNNIKTINITESYTGEIYFKVEEVIDTNVYGLSSIFYNITSLVYNLRYCTWGGYTSGLNYEWITDVSCGYVGGITMWHGTSHLYWDADTLKTAVDVYETSVPPYDELPCGYPYNDCGWGTGSFSSTSILTPTIYLGREYYIQNKKLYQHDLTNDVTYAIADLSPYSATGASSMSDVVGIAFQGTKLILANLSGYANAWGFSALDLPPDLNESPLDDVYQVTLTQNVSAYRDYFRGIHPKIRRD